LAAHGPQPCLSANSSTSASNPGSGSTEAVSPSHQTEPGMIRGIIADLIVQSVISNSHLSIMKLSERKAREE
ncbi:MAG: hypothetical protein ACE5JF_07960, partial [Anaerolineales bacterium]